MTSSNRRTCDTSFKLQVVKMIRNQGLSVSEVCRDQGLVNSAVRRWLAQYDAGRSQESSATRDLNAQISFSMTSAGVAQPSV
jgi:transposase